MQYQINESEHVTFLNSVPRNSVALLRIRNEQLIIQDTLDHLSQFVDGICVYDDCSNDETVKIIKSHPKVDLIIENTKWLPDINDRLISETRHRGLLHQYAEKYLNPNWFFCTDADERYFGDIAEFFAKNSHEKFPVAIRLRLFDAYLTNGDLEPVSEQSNLVNFRKYFGVERRDILMIWNREAQAKFIGLDSREPIVNAKISQIFMFNTMEKVFRLIIGRRHATITYDIFQTKLMAKSGEIVRARRFIRYRTSIQN